MNQVSQSLAGRTALLRLLPLSISESKNTAKLPSLFALMQRGFYARIYQKDLDPTHMLGAYFSTYVDRDLRQLSAIQDLQKFEHFVRLCAGRTGQLLNMNNLANDAAFHTVRHANGSISCRRVTLSFCSHPGLPNFEH